MNNKLWYAGVLLLGTAIGCGGGGEDAAGDGGSAEDPAAEVAAVEVAETPDAALQGMIHALGEGKPHVAWAHLPEKYKSDVNEVKNLFAEKMDAELWDKAFAVLQKGTQVLKEKRQFILSNEQLQANVNVAEAKNQWDEVVGLLSTLVNSEISSLEKMKSTDVGEFLAGTGEELMSKAETLSALSPDSQDDKVLEKMRQTKVTLIEEKNGTATVKLEAPGEEPEELTLVQVEGKWVPELMAKDWEKNVQEAKENLNNLTQEQINQMKPQVMTTLNMADSALDQMLAAKTQEEFSAGTQGLMGAFVPMMMGMGGGRGGPGGPPADFDPGDFPQPENNGNPSTPPPLEGEPNIDDALPKFEEQPSLDDAQKEAEEALEATT